MTQLVLSDCFGPSQFLTKTCEMSSDSEGDSSDISSDSDSSPSEASIESDGSTFYPYDECVEPLATEKEALEYSERVAREEEEEQLVEKRKTGEINIKTWCKCSNCSLENVTKGQECSCCLEEERCTEKMEEEDRPDECITLHPGFSSVCLDPWVLETAAVRLKTKANKTYSSQLTLGQTTKERFYRSVAYRQFVRFVWGYTGTNKRLPLPCCVYNAIRKEFPNPDSEEYKGFELDEELPTY